MSSPKNIIDELCKNFQAAWEDEALPRPLIYEYLLNVDPAVHNDLLSKLVPLDIGYRLDAREFPSPNDYLQLGIKATEFAKTCLDLSMMTFDTDDQINSKTRIEAEGDEGDDNEDAGTKLSDHSSLSTEHPMVIGPYKLIRRIGKGGMGAVFLAEQAFPVRRTVALKLIRADLGSQQAIERFKAERQAVALMDHPNIAKILDAGATPDGNPYFVMEYLDGISFNKYCDRHKLSIRERLKLMLPVCRAIQHAHQKGILHRDLKHSNVIITEPDGKPVPKVIDFGLAKSFSQDKLGDKTMCTELGNVIGTLQYMSPEQAKTEELDLDTRTDIYSLGIMVYKILTGTTPLENQFVNENSIVSVLEHIRNVDSPLPSARLERTKDLAKLAELRGVKPEKLKQIVTGDLDWIVAKSIEKDRDRRYETANALAMDIKRYLTYEAVQARSPSRSYLLRKFVRRNQKVVASLVLFGLILIGGVVGTSWGFRSALIERDRANNKTLEAERQSEIAKAAQEQAETQLHAFRMKSAFSGLQLGNIESVWLMLNELTDAQKGWESRFLETELSGSKNILYGHAGIGVDLEVSHDYKLLVTSSTDQTLNIWDAMTRQRRARIIAGDEVVDMKFSANDEILYTVDRGNRLIGWDVDQGTQLFVFSDFTSDLTHLVLLGDGDTVLVGSSLDNTQIEGGKRADKDQGVSAVFKITLSTKEVVKVIPDLKSSVCGLACSRDGRRLALTYKDSPIEFWDLNKDGQYVKSKSLESHTGSIWSLDISPSEGLLVSGGEDKTIKVWNFKTGKLVSTLVGHNSSVSSVNFSSDGSKICSASEDRTARIWDLQGKELLVCRGHYADVADACFLKDDEEIATLSEDRTTRIWSSEVNASKIVTDAHQTTLWMADFLSDQKTVVSVAEEGTIRLTDSTTGKQIGEVIQRPVPVLCVACAANQNEFVTGDSDAYVHVWKPGDVTPTRTINIMGDEIRKPDRSNIHYIWDVKYSPDDRYVVIAVTDKTARVFETKDWTEVAVLKGHTAELAAARFSPDGRLLATTSDDGRIKIWDAKSFELIETLPGHNNPIWRIEFSPDGRKLASSGYGGELRIWDVENRCLHMPPIKAHANQIAGLAFTADGSRIVTASDDKRIKIWDVNTGIELFEMRDKNDSPVVHVSFSRDGTRLVSGNNQGWLTFRTALKTQGNARKLPQDAGEYMIRALVDIFRPDTTMDDFQRECVSAADWCRYFPSYELYTIAGVCQYRLGRFEESVETLKEAKRLEYITYNQPDLRPDIEAFLSMSLVKVGQFEAAKEVREEFETKASRTNWEGNEVMDNIRKEVEQAFDEVE